MKKKRAGITIKSVIITLAVISVLSTVLVIGFSFYMADVFGGERYTEFDEQRKSEMMNIYGIKLTDDAEPVEYSTDVGFSDKALLIIKTDDCDRFMENCLPEEAEMTDKDEFRYSDVSGRIIHNEDGTYTIKLIR